MTPLPILKNQRHERFAQELAKGTPTPQAYVLAGYKKTHAHSAPGQVRDHPDVQRRYHELMEAAARQTEVTAASLVTELAKIAFSDIADFIKVDEAGLPQPDFSRVTGGRSAAVSEITVNEFESGRSAEGRAMRRVRFKLADKLAALVELCKIFGLYRERVEVSGPNGGPIETTELNDAEAVRRIVFMLQKAGVTTLEHEDNDMTVTTPRAAN